MKDNKFYTGIDLGTTNSAISVVNRLGDGTIESSIVDIERVVSKGESVSSGEDSVFFTEKKATLPSCVYYRDDKNYEPMVGDFARDLYPIKSDLVVKSIKSHMGEAKVYSTTDVIPDKTPEEISARILTHLIEKTSAKYKTDITNAVITVPANFDSIMCAATTNAAKMAGIENPYLLSEPKAVIYDLLNNIKNDKIPKSTFDLTTKKNIIVFDLGGGTLDITMYRVGRNSNNVKIEEVATNRYTLLGGDDFDEKLANMMYNDYYDMYSDREEAADKIEKNEEVIMARFRRNAENIKIATSQNAYRNACPSDTAWSLYPELFKSDTFPVAEDMPGIGYKFIKTYTKDDIENELSSFMGYGLEFDDYKNINSIEDTDNIIYPILDVLRKASKSPKLESLSVDSVILNGGMSKFYMIADRLEEFFGFKPINVLNRSQAVARGAAIYHYYKLNEDETPLVETGKNILNEGIYIATKNGGLNEIIPTGAELPYESELIKGFKRETGERNLTIPIKSLEDGNEKTIAVGSVNFRNAFGKSRYISIKLRMDSDKLISMKVISSYDENGEDVDEELNASINKCGKKAKAENSKKGLLAPSGSELKPDEEINHIIQLCDNRKRATEKKDTFEKSKITHKLNEEIQNIANSKNKADFAGPVLKTLEGLNYDKSDIQRQRIFEVAAVTAEAWDKSNKKKLARQCMNQLNAEIYGIGANEIKSNTNVRALYALSTCGRESDMEKLAPIREKKSYKRACIYAYSKTGTGIDWLLNMLEADVKNLKAKKGNNFILISYAIGIAMSEEASKATSKEKNSAVKKLCEAINSKKLNEEELINACAAIGYICKEANSENDINSKVATKAYKDIKNIEINYSHEMRGLTSQIRYIAEDMINGESLSEDDELYLNELDKKYKRTALMYEKREQLNEEELYGDYLKELEKHE